MGKYSKKITPKYVELGKFLKVARERIYLSQGDVKKILGYKSTQIISDWERGYCGVPKEAMPEIIKLYKIRKSIFIKKLIQASEKELKMILKGPKK